MLSVVPGLMIVHIRTKGVRMRTVYHKHLYLLPRSSVYIKHGRELTLLDNSSGIYQVGSLSVGLIDDGRWREKQSAFPLELD